MRENYPVHVHARKPYTGYEKTMRPRYRDMRYRPTCTFYINKEKRVTHFC